MKRDKNGTIISEDEEEWLEEVLSPKCRFVIHPQYHGYQPMPRGWGMDARAIDDHLMQLMLHGDGEARVAGRRLRLKPGDFIWISPYVNHGLHLPPGTVRQLMRFKLIGPGGERRAREDLIYVRNAWELLPHLEKCADEQHLSLPHVSQRVRSHLALLCSSAFRMNHPSRTGHSTFTDTQLRKLMHYVAKRMSGRPTPTDLANVLDLSADYFTRVFRRTFGLAPRKWLVRERIRQVGRELLESETGVKSIASKFGYDDLYFFSRQFKKVTGMSPRAFRQAGRESSEERTVNSEQ